MLEKEYKSLLTKDEYEKIKTAFEWDSAKVQENHYYTDNEGILRRNRVMMRVRVKDNKSVIQVKLHKNPGSALQICEETEYTVDGVPKSFQDGEKYTGIKTGVLYNIGCAKTLRHSKMWDDKTEICLDKTEYLGVCDYEIEIEYTTDEINPELMQKINGMGILFKENSIGKFSRFLCALDIDKRAMEIIKKG
ncbi:MAG: CYTH domain-containing protein [Clostridia bacterium]|nr:CYTH domain-containing protein [Clostridia bacterium]